MKLLLLSILFVGCIVAVKIKNAYIPSGLIFARHNDVYMVREYKQLRFSLNLVTYFQQVDILKNKTTCMTELCSKLNYPTTCYQYTEFLDRKIKEIVDEHTQIKMYENRPKRFFFTLIFSMIAAYIGSLFSDNNDLSIKEELLKNERENKNLTSDHIKITYYK